MLDVVTAARIKRPSREVCHHKFTAAQLGSGVKCAGHLEGAKSVSDPPLLGFSRENCQFIWRIGSDKRKVARVQIFEGGLLATRRSRTFPFCTARSRTTGTLKTRQPHKAMVIKSKYLCGLIEGDWRGHFDIEPRFLTDLPFLWRGSLE